MTALQIIGLILLIPGLGFFVLIIHAAATAKPKEPQPQTPKKKKNLYFIGNVPFYFDR